MSSFARLAPRLQSAIVSRLGWKELRPVQELAIEALLDGKNAVILAPTAGGKTEAALFPVLSSLVERPTALVGAIYVSPIKALLNNQSDRLGLYTEMVGLRRFVWHGDAERGDKEAFVGEPAELLMTTPESLEVMLISAKVPAKRLFSDLRAVVVDEVHAMAGTDRGAHLMSVLERIVRFSPHDVQRIGLSATVGNPEAIVAWLGGSSGRERVVIDPPKVPQRRDLLIAHYEDVGELTLHTARTAKGQKSLLFCQSRAMTEAVAEAMHGLGTDVFVHHSSVSAEERAAAEARFYRGKDACIVCTSTLELGIDVGDLDRVFQSEAPSTVSSFLQRMGRTGRRAGQSANMTFLCQSVETVLQAAALVELAREGWVESAPGTTRCWPVLVHQLLAMCLASGGVAPGHAWEVLHRVPDFAGIQSAEFDAVVGHMLANEDLFLADGRLMMGERAEKVYGRRNFMELYAVFSTPQLYVVVTSGGKELGSLEQNFVDQLEEDRTSFLLAGRPWIVRNVNHKERRVLVDSAPGGKKPSWGGFAPQILGYELCQKMREILASDAELVVLQRPAAELLAARRAEFAPILCDGADRFVVESGRATWWTFAGGRINRTLKHAFEELGPWTTMADNFQVRIDGEAVVESDVEGARNALRDVSFWNDEARWNEVGKRLPTYRLSKFQDSLPPWAQQEMLSLVLLDVSGARRFCMM